MNIFNSVIIRILLVLKYLLGRLNDYFKYSISRHEAKSKIRYIVKKRGFKIVDSRLRKHIKKYCQNRFGTNKFWPWLALYTEVYGSYKEGWVPIDYYRFNFLPNVNPEKYMRFSEAKAFDSKIFGDSVIESKLFHIRGKYFDSYGNELDKQKFYEIIKSNNKEIIIKPDDGLQGKGIIFVEAKNIESIDLPISNFVVQDVIEQSKNLAELYPYSLNTFRVMTYFNNGEIIVKFVTLKFGCNGSRVDNTTAGGGLIPIKLNGIPNKYAYDKNWIKYCQDNGIDYKLVDCYSNDIVKQITDCDALMWHHYQAGVKDIVFAKQLMYAVEHTGKVVFPDFRTAWHFDDKVGQKYLLESIGAELVPTYVFYDKEDAYKWIEQVTTFPKCSSSGAGPAQLMFVWLTTKIMQKNSLTKLSVPVSASMKPLAI
jgi:hypothetical protein